MGGSIRSGPTFGMMMLVETGTTRFRSPARLSANRKPVKVTGWKIRYRIRESGSAQSRMNARRQTALRELSLIVFASMRIPVDLVTVMFQLFERLGFYRARRKIDLILWEPQPPVFGLKPNELRPVSGTVSSVVSFLPGCRLRTCRSLQQPLRRQRHFR